MIPTQHLFPAHVTTQRNIKAKADGAAYHTVLLSKSSFHHNPKISMKTHRVWRERCTTTSYSLRLGTTDVSRSCVAFPKRRSFAVRTHSKRAARTSRRENSRKKNKKNKKKACQSFNFSELHALLAERRYQSRIMAFTITAR